MNDDLRSRYRSHPHKLLHIHMDGVMKRVEAHTFIRSANTSALFHDLGKLNPNFQPKLDNKKVNGYSSHAYLSAFAFLCFYYSNRDIARDILGIQGNQDLFQIMTLIARHHGNLPNFDSILSISERERLEDFLDTKPYLPISEYLQTYLPHQPFDVNNPEYRKLLKGCSRMKLQTIQEVQDKVGFFQETQFTFACLIESDKRDAGDIINEHRQENSEAFTTAIHRGLTLINEIAITELDEVRTKIREESVETLKALLHSHEEQRVFCLTAPTGAGKTRTLLTLAQTILEGRRIKEIPLFGVIYALPFLTITEQVEDVCRGLLEKGTDSEDGIEHLFNRFDSRSDAPQLDNLQEQLDSDPTILSKVLEEEFARRTFDYPFVVTTFVQFFETLMSNKNSTLLKLPKFAKVVILLDEIQSLPPRLYTFFVAYLEEFCRRFDSYVILSTATMPYLSMPDSLSGRETRKCFPNYQTPPQLLDKKWFSHSVFSRYTVIYKANISTIETLASEIDEQKNSSLVILNTIADTITLYKNIKLRADTTYLLLNTRFTPEDRREKVAICKRRLATGERVVLITTQLVEAGVDIDFPAVYRDLCPFPNLIQAAGRCNRNNTYEGTGQTYLFELRDAKGRSRAEAVYGANDGNPSWFLGFTRSAFEEREAMKEEELLSEQQNFFQMIAENLVIGDHPNLRVGESNLLLCVKEQAHEDVGRFRLIQEEREQYTVYVPVNNDDRRFADFELCVNTYGAAKRDRKSFQDFMLAKLDLESSLRQINQRTVNVRLSGEEIKRMLPEEPIAGVYLLGDLRNYTFEDGLKASQESIFF